MKHCTQCGTQLDDNSQFCQQCGCQQSPQQNQQPPYNQQFYRNSDDVATCDKDKIVFGILAILLGWIGVQYFYVDKVKAGVISILLSVVTCGFWEIIPFIQGIIVLCGKQRDFERKYVYSKSTLPLF